MTTPFYLYQDIPTDSDFQIDVETQAGIPVSATNKDGPRFSPFVMRFVPPDVLSGLIASGGQNDPYSARELTIAGGAINGQTFDVIGGQTYGQIESFVFDGSGDTNPETELVTSYTPLEFIQEFTLQYGRGNNFGYYRGRTNSIHRGVDIYVPQGTPVYAPFELEVISVWGSRNGDGNGRGVTLRSTQDPNMILRYIHLQDSPLSAGDVIPAGTEIGVTIQRDFNRPGEGGSRSHLHLEVALSSPDGRGNVNPYGVFDVSSVLTPNTQGAPAIKVAADARFTSRFGIYAESVANIRDSSYRNPNNQILQSVISLDRTQLESYVYQGKQVTSESTERAAIIDRAYKADLALQLQALVNAPPIVAMINPTNLSISQSKIHQFQGRTRKGYIYEEFRGDIWNFSLEFSTGGFYTDPGPRRGAGGEAPASPQGIQSSARRDSAAYQHFISTLMLYHNNGALIDRVSGSKSRPLVGAIAVEYDGWTYIGKFTSFSYTEDETSPYRLTFSMSFEATQRFAYDSANDYPRPLFDPNKGVASKKPSTFPQSPFLSRKGSSDNLLATVSTASPVSELVEPTVEIEATELVPNSKPFGIR